LKRAPGYWIPARLRSSLAGGEGIGAFSLVELLVVITVLVVLLALLAPALDQAVYQSELAVCGSKLKALGAGVVLYAMDHQRRYPHRPAVERGTTRQPVQLSIPVTTSPTIADDDRPAIRAHIEINNLLQCPLNKRVDLVATDDDTNVITSYGLWYGWRYGRANAPQRGMRRLGERFEWTDAGVSQYFRILAADWDTMLSNTVQGAHPDRGQELLFPRALQDEYAELAQLGGVSAGTTKFTLSLWVSGGKLNRGSVDRDFLYDDGSVRRLDALVIDDGRTVSVPAQANANDFQTGVRTWLPAD